MKSEKKSKIKILILVLVLLLLIVTCTFLFLTLTESENKEKPNQDMQEKEQAEKIWNKGINIDKNIKLEFLSDKTVEDFIQEKITLLENSKIDTTSLGKHQIEFTYQLDGKKEKNYGLIEYEVVDTTKPVIFGNSIYSVTVGSKLNVNSLFLSGDLCDDNPTRKIEGAYDLNKVGNYPVSYVVEDASGNKEVLKFTLQVIPKSSGGGSQSTTPKTTTSFQDVINSYKTKETKIGIDVSKWQGNINWNKVKAAGCEFAFIRIGNQSGINGEYILDPYFKQNLKNAKAAGIAVGVYFYSYANSIEEAERQAKWVIEQLDGETLELGISYDWESFSNFNAINLSFYHFNLAKEKFLDTVKLAGYKGMLYSSKYYLENIWSSQEYDTWLAHYTTQTNYQGNYFVWQKCNNGRISGISGDVDIDIMYVNKELYKN